MSRTQKHYIPVAVQRKREAAIAQANCHQGYHRMTPTFRPGEQVCTSCGIVQYCPVCLKEYQLPPSKSTHAFPQPCLLHHVAPEAKQQEVQA